MDRIPGAQTIERSLDRLGLAAGLLAPVAWGFTGVFVRLLHGVPTLAIVAGRLAIAALVLIPWILLRGRDFIGACRSPLSAAMGAYYILATEAFARAPVVEVTLVIGSAPVIAVALERLRGVRPVRQQVIGAIVAVAGLVLFLRPRAGIGTDRMFGYLFASGEPSGECARADGCRVCSRSRCKLRSVGAGDPGIGGGNSGSYETHLPDLVGPRVDGCAHVGLWRRIAQIAPCIDD